MGGLAKGLLGGGGGKASGTTSSQVLVPDWLDTKNQSLAGRAETLSNRTYTPYTGQRIAGLGADTNRAFGLNNANIGKFDNLYNSASQGAMDLMNRANGPNSAQIQQLMNPYLENVLNVTKRNQIQNAGREQSELARQKGLAGSFGGSRFALREQQQEQDLAQLLSDTDYKGLFDGFNQAQSQWNKGSETLGMGVQGALDTATQGSAYNTQDIMNLLKTGELQRASSQDQLDVNYDDFLKQQSWDYDQTNYLANILNPLTSGYKAQESTTTQNSGKSGGGLGQILGVGASIASLFSDERVKENIKDVGKLDNGLKVYSYNYKGSPKTQIGIMAQDVEKKNPDAVTENKDGIKMVDYEKATKKFADGGRVNFNRLQEAMRTPINNISGTSFSAPSVSPPEDKGVDFNFDGAGAEKLKEMLGSLFDNSETDPDDFDMVDYTDWMDGGLEESSMFGDIGNWFSNLKFAEGGKVGANPPEGVRPSTYGYIQDLLKTYSPKEILIVAEPQSTSDLKMKDGSPLWLPEELDYLRSLNVNFAGGGKVQQPDYTKMDIEEIIRDQRRQQLSMDIDPTKQSLAGIAARKGVNALGGAAAETLNIPSWLRSGMNEIGEVGADLFMKPAAQLEQERLANQTKKKAADPEAQSIKEAIAAKKGNVAPQADAATAVNPKAGPKVGPVPFAAPTRVSQPSSTMAAPVGVPKEMEAFFAPKSVEQPKKKEGGINMPLLMAGLAMMSSNGDDGLISNIAEGVGAATAYLGEQERAQIAAAEKQEKQKQQEFENYLAMAKLNQALKVAGMRGTITPYQQRMLELKERDLIRKENEAGSLIPDADMEAADDGTEVSDSFKEILAEMGIE